MVGDKCEKGSQLRPHVVWFGEPVDMISRAAEITRSADIVIVIGTSLAVYPAAGLIYEVPNGVPKYYIDPNAKHISDISNLTAIQGKAAEEVPKLVSELLML